MKELIKNKVYLCADGQERLLMDVTENHLIYGVEIKEGFYMKLSPTHKRYILKDFLNGTILEEKSEKVRRI